MKKLVSIILAVSVMLSVSACGGSSKKAFEISRTAYENIGIAYEITEHLGEDVYEAWRVGIYCKDEISVSLLASELNLTEAELAEGMLYTLISLTDITYEEATREQKQRLREQLELFFELFEESLFSACVSAVVNAYIVNGEIAEAQEALDKAKKHMKELSDQYSDYEHYPNLKEYYTTTSAFFKFCQDPTGSFKQITTTINDYQNEIRNYISDLDYIFEDE